MIFYTPKLEHLAGLAGPGVDGKRVLRENQAPAVVQDWQDSCGFDPSITRQQAVDLYSACTEAGGILPGIKKRW